MEIKTTATIYNQMPFDNWEPQTLYVCSLFEILFIKDFRLTALDFYASYRLSDNISVFAAEFFAIYKALEISSHCNFSHIVILSDSINSLNDIKFKTSKLFPTLLNSVTSLLSSCKKLHFLLCSELL